MSTCNFRVYTGAFALISDPLRYEIYKASAPLAVVASQTFSDPHPARTVNFLALARVNYIFKLIQETPGGDVAIIPDYNFTPDNDEIFYYPPVELQADLAPGLVSGTTSFTFDGTSGTPDWRGREIYTERVGQGTMYKGVQYSWDSATAEFNLLQTGDVFQPDELFNFEFDPQLRNSSSPVLVTPFSEVLIVTATTVLTDSDIGKKIIIKGATPYFEITLPEGATVPENTLTYFEWGTGSHINVKLKTFAGDTIDWGKGNLDHVTGGVSESIVLFWESTVGEWRVHDYDGNFLTVGRIIATDGTAATTENNVQLLDGSNMAFDTYKRLYEDFVQKLPPAQVCNYSDWGTGDNMYKFSYSNGVNFRIPDRRGLYQRAATGSTVAGTYQANKIKQFWPTLSGGALPSIVRVDGTLTEVHTDPGVSINIRTNTLIDTTLFTTETRPETYTTNQFILI